MLVAVVSACLVYVLFVKGMVDLGSAVYWMDVVDLVQLVVCFSGAIAAIKAGNVRLHRTLMLFATAGFMGNPTSRLFMYVLL